ncbi:MAG: hypothetical protein HY707_03190 [Ignavibacteriae bacterium]|nr:hypothetical protein [Ignavibacteriota bacterium]
MKSLLITVSLCVLSCLLFLSGCELITPPPKERPVFGIGDDLIINEVYAISPDKHYAFSWIELYNPSDRNIALFEQTFTARAYAVGADGTVRYTEEDGSLWKTVSIPELSGKQLVSVDLPYPDTGFIASYDGTFIRINRATKPDSLIVIDQTARLPGPINIRDMFFFPLQKFALMVGDGGKIFRTSNYNNLQWQTQTVPATAITKNLHSVFIITTLKACAVGDSGTILVQPTVNTWQRVSVPEIYQTTNFRFVTFVGAGAGFSDTGFVVGEQGAILKTTNDGNNWLAQTSGVTTTLRGAFFSPRDDLRFRYRTGWVVGDGGVILKTEDQGETWTQLSSGTSANLHSVTFYDSLRGWVFGTGGLILFTRNGGRTWNSQSSNTTSDLYNAYFLPPQILSRNYYLLTMRTQRKYYYHDPFNLLDPVTWFPPGKNPNYDFIVKTDTGTTLFIVDLDRVFTGRARSIAPRGFLVANSDSVKFDDHVLRGPGTTLRVNFSIAFDTVITQTVSFMGNTFTIPRPDGFHFWTLLSSGEIRLQKLSEKIKLLGFTAEFLGFSVRTLDVVRYGNYRPTPDDFPDNQPFALAFGIPNAGGAMIPEGWSLARYNNDVGGDPTRVNTIESFYMTERPIPGYGSLRCTKCE